MEKAQILKNIGSIGRASKKLTADIQSTAVGCALHAVKHGDVTLADQLVDALGKGMRKASLRAWFETNTPMFIAKGKDKFSLDAERAKTMRGMDAKVLEEGLMALAWEEAKPEEKVVSVFDVSEAFDKFMKRVESMSKDAEVTTRNKEMIDFLQSASAQYHEAKAMNARVSLSAE
jgi:hypothetical protein